jgi:hypothetical protein
MVEGLPVAALELGHLRGEIEIALASLSKGLFGGQLPWGMIGCGASIGAAIIALDEYLKASGAKMADAGARRRSRDLSSARSHDADLPRRSAHLARK